MMTTLQEAAAAWADARQARAARETDVSLAQNALTAAAQAESEAQRVFEALAAAASGGDDPEPLPQTLEERFQARLEQLAEVRLAHETGGIIVQDMPIKTDRESQGLLTSAYVMASKDPAFTVRWKVSNGVFVTIDAVMIIAAGDAVTAHVQACFAREEALSDALAAAFAAEDAEALDAIDITAGWPGD